jgi:hypothetical protein
MIFRESFYTDMKQQEYKILTGKDVPDLLKQTSEMVLDSWPEFMLHDPYVGKYWDNLFAAYPEFHFGLMEKQSGQFIALGNSLPLAWHGRARELPDEGIDWALEKGFKDYENKRTLTTLCALQIVIDKKHRNKGLSSRMVRCMLATGMAHGYGELIAPVRPPLKASYPLATIDQFIQWKNGDGHPLDPWMRVHVKLGAKIIKPCPKSMQMSGSISQWEQWTAMKFPETGPYVISGALSPIIIDRQTDSGLYIEPNVWMSHSLR